jgi:hypothetical protein
MIWLPYRRYQLTTQLNSLQLKQKMQTAAGRTLSDAEIKQGIIFNNDENTNGFNVSIINNKIYIKEPTVIRFGAYTNSFKPEAKIVMEDAPQGTWLRIVLKPPTFAMVFICVAVCFIVAAVMFSKKDDLAVGKHRDIAVVIFAVLMFWYFLPVVGFNADLLKIKLFIDDLFEADHEN